MAILNFTKMHGLGNDFIIVDQTVHHYNLNAQLIRKLANRYTGIGFDQLLLVEYDDINDVDFRYRIFNADGNEVEQCGNGARCFARYVHHKGLTQKRQIKVSTLAGIMTLNILDDNRVCVNMGKPNFTPSAVPFATAKMQLSYRIFDTECGVCSIGNPHCTIIVDDIKRAPVAQLGRRL